MLHRPNTTAAQALLALTLFAPSIGRGSPQDPLTSDTPAATAKDLPGNSPSQIDASSGSMRRALECFPAGNSRSELYQFGEHATGALITILKNDQLDDVTRAAACETLGAIGGENATSALRALADQWIKAPNTMRPVIASSLCMGLVHTSDDQHVKAIAQLLLCVDGGTPIECAEAKLLIKHALRSLCTDAAAEEILTLAKNDTLDPHIRASLLSADCSERSKWKKSFRDLAIASAESQTDTGAKMDFLVVAAELGANRVIPSLLDIARDSSNEEYTRRRAIQALEKLQAVDAFRSLLNEGKALPPKLQGMLVLSICRKSPAQDLLTLCKLARDESIVAIIPADEIEQRLAQEPHLVNIVSEAQFVAADQAVRFFKKEPEKEKKGDSTADSNDSLFPCRALDEVIPRIVEELNPDIAKYGDRLGENGLPTRLHRILSEYAIQRAREPLYFSHSSLRILLPLIRCYPTPFLPLLSKNNSNLDTRIQIAKELLQSSRSDFREHVLKALKDPSEDATFVNAVRLSLPDEQRRSIPERKVTADSVAANELRAPFDISSSLNSSGGGERTWDRPKRQNGVQVLGDSTLSPYERVSAWIDPKTVSNDDLSGLARLLSDSIPGIRIAAANALLKCNWRSLPSDQIALMGKTIVREAHRSKGWNYRAKEGFLNISGWPSPSEASLLLVSPEGTNFVLQSAFNPASANQERAHRALATEMAKNEKEVLEAFEDVAKSPEISAEDRANAGRYLELYAMAKSLNLKSPYRYDLASLEVICRGRTATFDANIPVAVILSPADDHNGAFRQLNDLVRQLDAFECRVLVYESASEAELAENAQEVSRMLAAQKREYADLLVVAGHGSVDSVTLTDQDGMHYDERRQIDVRDGEELSNLSVIVGPDGTVAVVACSAAEFAFGQKNVVQHLKEKIFAHLKPGHVVGTTTAAASAGSEVTKYNGQLYFYFPVEQRGF